MKVVGIVSRMSVKLDHSNNIVQQITLEVQGDLTEMKDLMRKPLMIDMKPAQMEIGDK